MKSMQRRIKDKRDLKVHNAPFSFNAIREVYIDRLPFPTSTAGRLATESHNKLMSLNWVHSV